jgi:hypothetical protein
MGYRRIDEDCPKADKTQHGRELHPLRERPSDKRRGDDREGQLEHRVDRLRDRRRQRVGVADALGDVADDALHEGAVEAADERGPGPERQAVGADQPQNADQTGDGEARHHRVAHIFLAHHAAVEESEARNGHHQNDGHRG